MERSMMDRIRAMLLIVSAVGLLVSAGCGTYEQRRQEALARYERAAAKAKLPLVRDLLKEDRAEEAYTLVSECVAGDPENAEAQALKGEVALAMGHTEEAEACLARSVALDETQHRAWAQLGTIAQQNKEPQRALECYGKALALDPDNVDYIMLVVQTSAAQGQYEAALAVLDEKIALLPDNVRLRIAEGDLRHRMGDLSGATEAYRKALILRADNPDVMESLAYCYVAQQQWGEAAKLFERLAETAEASRRVSYQQMLATCSMQAGQYGQAVRAYDALSVRDRDNPDLWLEMGRAALGSGQAQRALTCAERALTLQPGWDEALALKGCALYLRADYAPAIEVFRQISTNDRLGGFAWLMVGRCYQQMGQLTRAQAAYERAAELDPDSKLVSLLTPSKGSPDVD